MKLFCKYTIKKLINYCPGGSYLGLKRNSAVNGDRPIISVEYKYNTHQFLLLINTEDAGRKI